MWCFLTIVEVAYSLLGFYCDEFRFSNVSIVRFGFSNSLECFGQELCGSTGTIQGSNPPTPNIIELSKISLDALMSPI